MPVDKKKRAYTLYSLVRTLFDEAALAALVLWLLPMFGINIPIWFLAALMVAWAVYSHLTSRLAEKVFGRVAAVGPETLIGVKCTTTTSLFPDGYVRVGTELWRARSIAGDIDVGAEVVIVDINKLTLLVKPSTNTALARERSRAKAIDHLYNFAASFGNVEGLAVEYATDLDEANRLLQRLHSKYPEVPIYLSRASPVIGTHTGPGLIVVSVFGNRQAAA